MDKQRALAVAGELSGQSVGGWNVGEYLGNGCSAVVLSATMAGRNAALKIIDPEMVERAGLEKQLARIRREKSLKGHGHPHLVEILDGGKCEVTNYLYVAMELLEPCTLGQVLKDVPTANFGRLIGQLASAARFLEEKEIVHRDIKPDNTNVSGDFTQIKLLDLGVIHPPRDPDDNSAGTDNSFVGTASYSPPEFLHREEEDSKEGWRAVTFYQLGATLYDMLMRGPIFAEFREPRARLYEAIRDHVPVIDSADETIEPWLVDLARRCLYKDWRVRKEIVSWKDFEGPRKTPISGEIIRSRIKKRLCHKKKAKAEGVEISNRQPTQRTLTELARMLTTTIRELCQNGEVFPPVKIKQKCTKYNCTLLVRTGPSFSHQLVGSLEARFVVIPLDTLAQNVCVMVDARLLDSDSLPIVSEEVGEHLFSGNVRDLELRERLDQCLHACLESSMGAGKPPNEGLKIYPNLEGR